MRRAALVLVLSLALAASVAACGGDSTDQSQPTDSSVATPAESSGADLSPATDGDEPVRAALRRLSRQRRTRAGRHRR